MELLQLRYFKEAAECENFSSVAQKFMVPQPSISKTIKKLEEELGVQLFDRHGKKIALNGNGKFFYEKVNLSLTNLDEGITHFSHAKSNIILYPQAGGRLVSLLIADFLTSNADIFLSSVYYSSENENHYDFTFMQPQDDMSSYDFIDLMKDEIIVIVSTNHPLSSKDEISLSDLKDEKFIAHYPSMNLRQFTDHYCKAQGGFEPIVTFETHDYSALRYLVENNKGIALLPKAFFMIQPGPNIHVVSLKEKAYRPLILAWKKGKILNESEKKFIEYTKNWFSKF
ncbi:MAG: LysR family transcriptional regulator [Eubacterium sp.]|nr:LysR family transcriptional regulator [Eubacterium sp.]